MTDTQLFADVVLLIINARTSEHNIYGQLINIVVNAVNMGYSLNICGVSIKIYFDTAIYFLKQFPTIIHFDKMSITIIFI